MKIITIDKNNIDKEHICCASKKQKNGRNSCCESNKVKPFINDLME